jgi:hypothetical protein
LDIAVRTSVLHLGHHPEIKAQENFDVRTTASNILVNCYFVTVIASAFQRSNLLQPRDCFGKKRLAMTAILALNEYTNDSRSTSSFRTVQIYFGKMEYGIAANSDESAFIDLYACAALGHAAQRMQRQSKNAFSDNADNAGSKIGVPYFSRR